MTENNMTPEEKRKIKVGFAKKTLENKVFQDVLGSNRVRSDPFLYGQLVLGSAEGTYEDVLETEEVQKVRSEIYRKAKEKGRGMGVYGDPSGIGNYEISTQIIEQLEESKQTLSLGELEEVVRGLAEDLDFELPETFKDRSILGLAEKRKSDFTKDDKNILIAYQILSQIYDRATALKAGKENYFADLVGPLKEIQKNYAPSTE